MTILAAFSASRHSSAPLNLAIQIARTTGEQVIAAAVVERSWATRDDMVEGEYLAYVRGQATQALQRAVAVLPVDLDVTPMVHESTSIPTGLIELADAHRATMVCVGSSSSGGTLITEGLANVGRLLPLAVEAGVNVLAGTDRALETHDVAHEALRLNEMGLGIAETIAAVSGNGYRATGRDTTFLPGTEANAVLFSENPIADIGVLAHPSHVIRLGRVVG